MSHTALAFVFDILIFRDPSGLLFPSTGGTNQNRYLYQYSGVNGACSGKMDAFYRILVYVHSIKFKKLKVQLWYMLIVQSSKS